MFLLFCLLAVTVCLGLKFTTINTDTSGDGVWPMSDYKSTQTNVTFAMQTFTSTEKAEVSAVKTAVPGWLAPDARARASSGSSNFQTVNDTQLLCQKRAILLASRLPERWISAVALRQGLWYNILKITAASGSTIYWVVDRNVTTSGVSNLWCYISSHLEAGISLTAQYPGTASIVVP